MGIGPDSSENNSIHPPRLIALRWPGTCCQCNTALGPGTKAWWDVNTKSATCVQCSSSHSDPEPSTATTSTSSNPTSPSESLDLGVAGGSARRRFEQLHDRRERQIEQKWGRLAGVVKFLSDDPQSTAAWAKGSKGEQILAEHMTRVLGDRAVLLHDRTVVGTRRNIDHLAVAASGVWVIDTKYYKGLVELRDVGGWFKSDRRLYVNRRDRTNDVQGLGWQLDAVRSALESIPIAIPLYGALCFVDAEWKLFAKPFTLNGVRVSGPKSLSVAVAQAGTLSSDEVIAVAGHLAAALPSKRS